MAAAAFAPLLLLPRRVWVEMKELVGREGARDAEDVAAGDKGAGRTEGGNGWVANGNGIGDADADGGVGAAHGQNGGGDGHGDGGAKSRHRTLLHPQWTPHHAPVLSHRCGTPCCRKS